MQDQPSVPAAGTSSSRAALASAFAAVGYGAWLAVALVLAGWFLMNTFHVDLGVTERNLRFFDLASVIDNPARLFTGIKQRGAGTMLFVMLCAATLLSPIVPGAWRDPRAWLALTAPAMLMLVCFLLLVARTSGSEVPAEGADTIASDLRHLGRHVLDGARNGMGRRVSLAPGASVAALGALCLAVLGIRGYRQHRRR